VLTALPEKEMSVQIPWSHGNPDSVDSGLADQRRRLDHEVHVLFNRRQEARDTMRTETWEAWLYTAKTAAQERLRLRRLFAAARLKQLPQTFQYCSHSPVEAVPEANHLTCCLGQRVDTCPILADTLRPLEGQFPSALLDEMQADLCVGHIVWETARIGHMLDGNEGYVQDVTDRMYWDRVAESLSQTDEGEEP
jgi:hypothetical protein